MTPELGIIGCGNMGEAILRGALRAKVLAPAQIVVSDADPTRCEAPRRSGCTISRDPADVLACSQLLIAVKPQSFPALARAIGPLRKRTVVISIMAGLSSTHIRGALGESAAVVRVMPNTPCQIGEGISAVALGEGAREGDDDLARKLFNAVGQVVTVDESQIYAVTAVSGSGPAYVFLLAEAMERAAVELGIDERTARQLVIQTIRGAGGLLVSAKTPPAELRAAVTSRGGTTAAALEVMDRRDLPRTVVEAITRARDRGIELDRMVADEGG